MRRKWEYQFDHYGWRLDKFDPKIVKAFIQQALDVECEQLRKKIEGMKLSGYPLPDIFYEIEYGKKKIGDHRSQAYNRALDEVLKLLDSRSKGDSHGD